MFQSLNHAKLENEMRDIEGLEEAISELDRHWPKIKDYFNNENEKYLELLNRDSTKIGRVLKCHLIIEHYLDNYLSHYNKLENIQELRLSFHQKTLMLPTKGSSAAVVRPGIIEVNKVRNKYGHNINTEIVISDINAINQLLRIARPSSRIEDPIEMIEAFSTIACTWLIVSPPDIEVALQKIFSKISIKGYEELS